MNDTAKNIFIAVPDFFIVPSDIALDEDLRPLDGYVYAVVYWYTKLKLERCTASNRVIAEILSKNRINKIHHQSVSDALTRLAKKGYVKILLDDENHRTEIIPLVAFTNQSVPSTPTSIDDTPTSNDVTPYVKQRTLPTSNDVQKEKYKERVIINNIYQKEKNNKKEKDTTQIQEILNFWNTTFNSKYTSIAGIVDNAAFWLTQYSADQIKQAVANIKLDNFWKDKMTPITFFRRKNPNHEAVDYIGLMLNLKGEFVKPMTEFEKMMQQKMEEKERVTFYEDGTFDTGGSYDR